jgi:ABC-type sulfate transport system permease subunit
MFLYATRVNDKFVRVVWLTLFVPSIAIPVHIFFGNCVPTCNVNFSENFFLDSFKKLPWKN